MASVQEERRQRIAGAYHDHAARAAAAKAHLYFRLSETTFAGMRTSVYGIMRGSWRLADYHPSTGKLRMADGVTLPAESLANAIEIVAEREPAADNQRSLPGMESRPQRRKTHKPKKASHMAKGVRLAKAAPTMYLSDDDWPIILDALASCAALDERHNPNMTSVNRELRERIAEARLEGCRIISEPKPQTTGGR